MLGLALAMLLSQSLGQLHAVKHDWSASNHHQHHQAAHETHHHDGLFEQLFSSHSSDSDCRLFDQLSASHAMPALAPLVPPVVLPALAVAIFAGEAIARWEALFDARGPPLTF